jgi:hypothetical protein
MINYSIDSSKALAPATALEALGAHQEILNSATENLEYLFFPLHINIYL